MKFKQRKTKQNKAKETNKKKRTTNKTEEIKKKKSNNNGSANGSRCPNNWQISYRVMMLIAARWLMILMNFIDRKSNKLVWYYFSMMCYYFFDKLQKRCVGQFGIWNFKDWFARIPPLSPPHITREEISFKCPARSEFFFIKQFLVWSRNVGEFSKYFGGAVWFCC